MSAGTWTKCPKCGAVNEDADPDDEYYHTVRVDHSFCHDQWSFSVSFWCVECDWSAELTEKDISVK